MRRLEELRRLRMMTLEGDVHAARELSREAVRRGDDALLRLCAWALVKAAPDALVVEVGGARERLIGWAGTTCLSAPFEVPRRLLVPVSVEMRWDAVRALHMACDAVEAVLELLERRGAGDPRLTRLLRIARDEGTDTEGLREGRKEADGLAVTLGHEGVREAAEAVLAIFEGRLGAADRLTAATLASARAASRLALALGQPQLATRHVSLHWQRDRLLDHLLLDGPPEEMAPLEED